MLPFKEHPLPQVLRNLMLFLPPIVGRYKIKDRLEKGEGKWGGKEGGGEGEGGGGVFFVYKRDEDIVRTRLA